MKELFAKRLKSARLLASMSQDDLVEKMNRIISKNAIAKYERAEMGPNSSVLIALSQALGVKPDYFMRPYTVEISEIEFRNEQNLNKKQVSSIKEMVSDRVERYLEIEKLLNISYEFTNPLKEVEPIKNGNDVEDAVAKLRAIWDLGTNAIPNVIEALEDQEIKIIELDADEGFDGLSGLANKSIPFIVYNSKYTVERKRFTVLHELGHLLLKFAKAVSKKLQEKLCNRFAAAMLIPKSTFITELGAKRRAISLKEVVSIKMTYGISVQAIMARAMNLGVITKTKFLAFRNWIQSDLTEANLGSYSGREYSDRFVQLVYHGVSEELVSMSKGANLMNQKLAVFRNEFVSL